MTHVEVFEFIICLSSFIQSLNEQKTEIARNLTQLSIIRVLEQQFTFRTGISTFIHYKTFVWTGLLLVLLFDLQVPIEFNSWRIKKAGILSRNVDVFVHGEETRHSSCELFSILIVHNYAVWFSFDVTAIFSKGITFVMKCVSSNGLSPKRV
jgi:hypothetical protein